MDSNEDKDPAPRTAYISVVILTVRCLWGGRFHAARTHIACGVLSGFPQYEHAGPYNDNSSRP